MATQTTRLHEALADFALGLGYDALSPPVVERTKQLFVDFLGVACGGRRWSDAAAPLLQAVGDVCAGHPGEATVIGEERLFPAQYAALLNGAFAHSMDFDDTHRESVMHPGTPVFATLLAAGEVASARGTEFLTAAVAGYEISCRLGKIHGDGVHRRGFHPTATTGIFGATAALARLYGVGREVLLNAWGITLSMAAGTLQFLENGAWNKPLQVGWAAHSAILATALARRGVIGAADPLDGRFGYYRSHAEGPADFSAAAAGLGREFEVMRTAVKPYPCCRYSHGVIDAVIALGRRHRLEVSELAEIEIGLNRVGLDVVAEPEQGKKAPAGIVEGQFSVYFAAAIAFLEGGYAWESYARLADPLVRELMGRMRAVEVPVPLLGSRVTLTARSGERFTAEVPLAAGEPETFPSWDGVRAKARSLMRSALPAEQVEPLLEDASRMEEVENLALLARYLRPPGAAS